MNSVLCANQVLEEPCFSSQQNDNITLRQHHVKCLCINERLFALVERREHFVELL